MTRPFRDALALAALFAALACPQADGARAKGPPGGVPPFHLVPERAELDPAMEVTPGGGLDLTRNGLRIRVEPLTSEQREAFFRLRTPEGFNVLPEVETHDPFMVFALSLENGTGADVTFLASLTEYRDQNDAAQSPVPFDSLFALFLAAFENEPDPDAAARRSLACIHGQALILHHGQRATKLLVFPPPRKGAKRFDLTLDEIQVADRVEKASFPWTLVFAEAARR